MIELRSSLTKEWRKREQESTNRKRISGTPHRANANLSKLNSRIDELLPELYAANKRGASLKALAKKYKIEGTDSLAVQVSSLSHKIREQGRLVLDAYKAERERQRNSNRLANRFHGVRRNFGSIPSLDIFLDIEAGMSPEATAEKHRVICIIVNRVCEAFSNFEHAKQYKRLDPGSDVCVGFNARPLSGPDLSVDIEILRRRRSGADLQKLSEIFCVSARAIELKLQKLKRLNAIFWIAIKACTGGLERDFI